LLFQLILILDLATSFIRLWSIWGTTFSC